MSEFDPKSFYNPNSDPSIYKPPFNQIEGMGGYDSQQFKLNGLEIEHDGVLEATGIKDKIIEKWDEERSSGLLHALEIVDPEHPEPDQEVEIGTFIGTQVGVCYIINDQNPFLEDGDSQKSEPQEFEAVFIIKKYYDKQGNIRGDGRVYPVIDEDEIDESMSNYIGLGSEDNETVGRLIDDKLTVKETVDVPRQGEKRRPFSIPSLDDSLVAIEKLPKAKRHPSDTI